MSKKNRSIRDFFLPASQIPARSLPDGDLIVVGAVGEIHSEQTAPAPMKRRIDVSESEPAKRRKIWSANVSFTSGSSAPPSPTTHREPTVSNKSTSTATNPSPKSSGTLQPEDEEEDPSIKAAIAASLKNLEESNMASPALESRPSSANLSNMRSSFGSNPRSSQSGSSKRVIEHGQEVVKGSDTDTDSGSDSEDLPPLPRSIPASTSLPVQSAAVNNDQFSLRDRISKDTRKPSHSSVKPPKKKFAFSLDTLVTQTKKSAALEARTAEALEKLQRRAEKVSYDNSGGRPLDMARLATLVEGSDAENEGKARRVMEALARTESGETEEIWHFFEEHPAEIPGYAFPEMSMQDSRVRKMLSDPTLRPQAYLSGFVPSLALHNVFPPELLIWTLGEVCTETRENLIRVYISTLKNSAPKVKTIFDTEQLLFLFKHLGAKSRALNPAEQIGPDYELSNAPHRNINGNVQYVAILLRALAPALPANTRDLAIQLLARASFDASVSASGELQIKIEDALISLIASIPESDVSETLNRISNSLFDSVTSTVLRHQLVAALPCRDPRTHLWRRRLALAFVLGSSRWLDADMSSLTINTRIILCIVSSPAYKISPSTNYVVLTAALNLMDIAIDTGFSDFAFIQLTSEESSDDNVPGTPTKGNQLLGKKRKTVNVKTDSKEAEFNDKVDMTVQALRNMMSKIVDVGASHMRRTVAKSAGERLIQRLELSVRTKEKGGRNHFADYEAETATMENFVVKGKRKLGGDDEVVI